MTKASEFNDLMGDDKFPLSKGEQEIRCANIKAGAVVKKEGKVESHFFYNGFFFMENALYERKKLRKDCVVAKRNLYQYKRRRKEMEKKNNRMNQFSYIRAVSCIAIICLHTIFTAVGIYGKTVTSNQLISYRIVIDNLMWAVPCFLMVTGALLLNKQKEISYHKLFTKYIGRILMALIIFVSVFSIIDTFFGPEAPSMIVFLKQMSEIFTGKSWSHIWYLYCLIGLYLLLPFYKKIVNASSQAELQYLLVLYAIFLSIIPVLNNWDIQVGFYIHVSTIYPFYFFAGYYLWTYRHEKNRTGIVAAVLGTVFISTVSWISWAREADNLRILVGYSSIFVIIQSCGIFMLFAKIKENKITLFNKLLIKIDENSFGIYLIHMIFVRFVFKQMGLNPFEYGGWLCILVLVLSITTLSWLLVYILKKIPVLRGIL